jgi:hypothetical protein
LLLFLQVQLDELREKMGANLSERYVSQQEGTAKVMANQEKLRKDLLKVGSQHHAYTNRIFYLKVGSYSALSPISR